ncbi:hypothetical protein HDU91_005762 [Kappamyces sp. JEL0680]|nr:hypothetical protein HDU91_005762 [Kappamyces sp. JEL0680]
MRAKTIQIIWHDKQPIFSVDFDPLFKSRFATCGGDTNIRIWSLDETESESIKYLATLGRLWSVLLTTRHSSGVNCVRFSPVASILASAGDDGSVLLWEQTSAPIQVFGQEEDEDSLEHWKLSASLRGSNQEVYDIAWCPDGSLLAAGGMDGCVRIFDAKERKLQPAIVAHCVDKVLHVLADHSHFVQGLAWDPLYQYLASQSNDRSMIVYKYERDSTHPRFVQKHTKTVHEKSGKSIKLFHDEEVNSFFRRLSFSPDGAILVTPTGIFAGARDTAEPNDAGEDSVPGPPAQSEPSNTCYVFPRGGLRV